MQCLASGHGSTLNAFDTSAIYLRLPDLDRSYELGLLSTAPFFNNGIIDPFLTKVGPRQCHHPHDSIILESHRWADIASFVHSGLHYSSPTYAKCCEAFVNEMLRRSLEWEEVLPEQLAFNVATLREHLEKGTMGFLVFMHLLHDMCNLQATRYARHSDLPPAIIRRHIQLTHRAARHILSIATDMSLVGEQLYRRHRLYSQYTPYTIDAILSAVDVVTSGGHESQLSLIHI